MINYPVRELPSERSFGLLFGDVSACGPRVRPEQTLWDSVGVAFRSLVTVVPPFLLGRQPSAASASGESGGGRFPGFS